MPKTFKGTDMPRHTFSVVKSQDAKTATAAQGAGVRNHVGPKILFIYPVLSRQATRAIASSWGGHCCRDAVGFQDHFPRPRLLESPAVSKSLSEAPSHIHTKELNKSVLRSRRLCTD